MHAANPQKIDAAASEALAARLVGCLPAATYEMETLCRLASIDASREIATAAIEYSGRPRLLVNPDFVDAFCRRDEHLFLLVMHELWHVILAHTTLYPRGTPAENLAFDAIINAGLARQFPGPEYRGFFEALNAADSFPSLLLRPPEGWPDRPQYAIGVGPERTAALVHQLYPSPGLRQPPLPLYSEILELLAEATGEDAARVGRLLCGGEPDPDGASDEPFLLGEHCDLETEAGALEDPFLSEAVRQIVGAWPPPPFPLKGRDAGGTLHGWLSALRPAPAAVRRAFTRVLRRALGPVAARAARRERTLVATPGGPGPLPCAGDRLRPAKQRLGLPTTLWQQRVPVRLRTPERPACAHVYLDVSGSMFGLLPHLAGLLVPYVLSGQARLFQFSTQVEPLPLSELRAGKLRTTNGTAINCVFEHVLQSARLRRVLVLTDGYTGPGRDDLLAAVRERNLRLHVVLPAESAWRDDLAPVATSLTVLPSLAGGSA